MTKIDTCFRISFAIKWDLRGAREPPELVPWKRGKRIIHKRREAPRAIRLRPPYLNS